MEVFYLKTYDNILSFENSFYKELYEDGAKQRDRINNKFAPTLTILTAEFSGIIWLLFKIIKLFSDHEVKVCLLFGILAIILLGVTIIFFTNAVIDFIFSFLKYEFYYPQPQKAKNIIENSKTYLGEYSEEEVLNNIIRIISNSYCEMAINNIKEINERSKYLNKAYTKIVWALGLMLITFVVVLCL